MLHTDPVSATTTEWGRFAADSIEQRMLVALGEFLGTTLRPRAMSLENGTRVEVEGMDPAGTVVVQLLGNQGAYKPTYRNKTMADLFKLVWLLRAVPTAERAVLVVSEVVERALGGWVGTAASDLGVEVLVFDGERVAPSARTKP